MEEEQKNKETQENEEDLEETIEEPMEEAEEEKINEQELEDEDDEGFELNTKLLSRKNTATTTFTPRRRNLEQEIMGEEAVAIVRDVEDERREEGKARSDPFDIEESAYATGKEEGKETVYKTGGGTGGTNKNEYFSNEDQRRTLTQTSSSIYTTQDSVNPYLGGGMNEAKQRGEGFGAAGGMSKIGAELLNPLGNRESELEQKMKGVQSASMDYGKNKNMDDNISYN